MIDGLVPVVSRYSDESLTPSGNHPEWMYHELESRSHTRESANTPWY
jgi:hypothetical protein